MPTFLLPDLGEGLTDAEIVGWRVSAGDEVHIDQIVVEVETAKAVVEVPVPYAGIVTELHGQPGDRLAVGSPLITVSVVPADTSGFQEPGIVVPEQPAGAETSGASGNVLIGYGTSASPRRRRRAGIAAAATPAAATPESAATVTVAGGPVAAKHARVISPLVRRLARESGVDVQTLTGSGCEGIVLRRDVEQAIRAHRAEPQAAETIPAAAPSGRTESEQRIPLRGIRKLAADKLSRSRREIPEATVWVDVDATALLEARATLNAANPDEPVSLLALFARFAVLGLQRYPELNGRIEDDEIVLPSGINLGFAAQTDRGLVVPVVHAADRMSTIELSAALATTTSAARSGTLAPAMTTGGTFTVNNYGPFGVDGSAAIINHPEVAILGLGRIIDRPWVVGGEIVVRKVSQLTLAFDHRVCDGGTAGGFLRFVADCVEQPVLALGRL